MKRPKLIGSILALMAVIAISPRIHGAQAEADPVAAIQAMTNVVARGNAWTKHITALAETSFAQAEELLAVAKGEMDGSQLANLYAGMAVAAVKKTSDVEKVKALFNAIKSVQDASAQTDVQKKRFEGFRTGRLCWAISQMTRDKTGHRELAQTLLKENRKLLDENQIDALEVDFLIAAANGCDRQAFDRDLAVYLKQPMSKRKVVGLARIARAISADA